jgi:SpoVK/Ycf46/Vps4 family AAA+-type ATPase
MKRWSAANDVFRGAAETYDQLPAGLYRTDIDHYTGSPLLVKQKHETDGLLELPDDASLSILAEFDDFWERRQAFKDRGFLHKRGFILWGPPGSGKTSCVNLLIKRLIKDSDGIVLFLDHPSVAGACLRMLRLIEPDRPIVAIMEDIDALVQRHGEHEYLSLLDGEAQVDRICFVATTNYPERLDRRFCDRPSRFDTVQYIGMPSAVAREAYLKAKEPTLEGSELRNWVAQTDGFSLAHLKELIVAVKCLGQSFEKALGRLESMRVARPTSEDEPTRRKIGFSAKLANGAHA